MPHPTIELMRESCGCVVVSTQGTNNILTAIDKMLVLPHKRCTRAHFPCAADAGSDVAEAIEALRPFFLKAVRLNQLTALMEQINNERKI